MSRPDFEGARQHALERLERELPADLFYHSLWHTHDDVVPAVERLAAVEQIAGEPLLLLRTAAYFHDIGFIKRRQAHEEAGVEIANATLPGFGYQPKQIEAIAAMIIATRLPQAPVGMLQQILADADLDVLGRADFWQRNLALRRETEALGGSVSNDEWLRLQLRFLESHRYWTVAARSQRDQLKQRHIAEMRERLGLPLD